MKYTERIDKALRIASWAHEQVGQRRKGTDIPYIIHPFGVMIFATSATDDEDVLIACLLHDVLEDVPSDIYSEEQMISDFGDRVVSIVKDVTNDKTSRDWYKRSNRYLDHLENSASDEAVIVSAADKVHNLFSTLVDYQEYGDELWTRFSTGKAEDQLWWYESILEVAKRRLGDIELVGKLELAVDKLRAAVSYS
jgi:(p)ppGpp synthase/HD superfamily hydrolase